MVDPVKLPDDELIAEWQRLYQYFAPSGKPNTKTNEQKLNRLLELQHELTLRENS
jgi:hypothetical protein